MKFYIAAVFFSLTVANVSYNENFERENNLNINELYACDWFPICTEPDNPQKRESVKPDSSSKDKKDQKESGRMA